MNTRQLSAVRTPPISTMSFTPVRSGLLQRKCACGGTPGPTGECEECSRKRLSGQRRAPLGLQTKLAVNQAGDRLEQEADRIAEQIMRMPSISSPSTQPQGLESRSTGNDLASRKAETDDSLVCAKRLDEDDEIKGKLAAPGNGDHSWRGTRDPRLEWRPAASRFRAVPL